VSTSGIFYTYLGSMVVLYNGQMPIVSGMMMNPVGITGVYIGLNHDN
jgi:hypothetical protein